MPKDEHAQKVPVGEQKGLVTDVIVPLAGPATTLYGIHQAAKLAKPKDPPEDK
jgi:hypothetical protein